MSDDDGPRYILQSGPLQVIQRPPAIAHVCEQSRNVALRTGRMFLLENGRLTWFRPETDVFLWAGLKLGCELSLISLIPFPAPLFCSAVRF